MKKLVQLAQVVVGVVNVVVNVAVGVFGGCVISVVVGVVFNVVVSVNGGFIGGVVCSFVSYINVVVVYIENSTSTMIFLLFGYGTMFCHVSHILKSLTVFLTMLCTEKKKENIILLLCLLLFDILFGNFCP